MPLWSVVGLSLFREGSPKGAYLSIMYPGHLRVVYMILHWCNMLFDCQDTVWVELNLCNHRLGCKLQHQGVTESWKANIRRVSRFQVFLGIEYGEYGCLSIFSHKSEGAPIARLNWLAVLFSTLWHIPFFFGGVREHNIPRVTVTSCYKSSILDLLLKHIHLFSLITERNTCPQCLPPPVSGSHQTCPSTPKLLIYDANVQISRQQYTYS